MKIALFADIHSNLEALQACLAHADSEGAEQAVFLGDLVGYGASPLECLELVALHAARGALVVRGNHDEAALGGMGDRMNPTAREAIYWTRAQLGPRERVFLSGLPMTARLGELLLVHASARDPETWPYIHGDGPAGRCLEAADAEICVVGHVHRQMLYGSSPADRRGRGCPVEAFVPVSGAPFDLSGDRRWLAIAGSVGQPRDGNNAAAYALFDDAGRQLTFFRVPYDHHTAARKIAAAGLPQQLAVQLLLGE